MADQTLQTGGAQGSEGDVHSESGRQNCPRAGVGLGAKARKGRPVRWEGREELREAGVCFGFLPTGETAVGGGQWEHNGLLRPFPPPGCLRSTGKGVNSEPLFCVGIMAALHLDLGQPSNPSRFHRWQHTERGTCPRSLTQEVMRWESNLVLNHPKPMFFSRTRNEWVGMGLVGLAGLG